MSSIINTIILIIISTIVLYIIYKYLFGHSKNLIRNTIMIIGPSQSGKTTFFYFLIGKENQKTIMSMEPNELLDCKSPHLNEKYDIIDYPGTGYYQEMIINKINQSKIILLFIDSSDKNSIVQSAKYIYDILNSDKFDLDTNLVICCNKQDNNFPKTKKIIEDELNKEIENLKIIKQKNNLEDSVNMGYIFQMKKKFNFKMFENVIFIESDMKSKYINVINKLKEILESH